MRNRMVVALVLAVALVFPSGAFAGKPVREVRPSPPDETVTACGFPVLIHSEGRTIRKTWYDDDGNPVRAIETYPGFKSVLTNLLTREQIVLAIVGPAKIEFGADGSETITGAGPWSWYPTNPVTEEPGIFLIRGRLTFTIDAEGNFSFEHLAGQIDDLCPALA